VLGFTAAVTTASVTARRAVGSTLTVVEVFSLLVAASTGSTHREREREREM
jgi:hypothetical protein